MTQTLNPETLNPGLFITCINPKTYICHDTVNRKPYTLNPES
eukprot:CAMPEP_0198685472 /NCGR_PEP_ID=MMETSP1468-20131203/13699_1 /TAXON_ID=1461545 /ORGANISM="Mantoniella sp, Strain CCMP1436" /LENGTH=41 /DNA_ID= /DNA_START= /DNA_END= /DNA_ORIENTATION=